MRVLTIFLFFISIIAHTEGVFSQEQTIEAQLSKKETLHNMSSWAIMKEKSSNGGLLFLEVVEYDNILENLTIEGVKFTLTGRDGFTSSRYLSSRDYAGIMVILNDLKNGFVKQVESESTGYMSYITKDGIKIGYDNSEQGKYAYVSFQKNKELMCTFTDIPLFLDKLRNAINIAQNKLYLPEKVGKAKKVKKSSSVIKDISIEDL